jgi:hypothetical protein
VALTATSEIVPGAAGMIAHNAAAVLAGVTVGAMAVRWRLTR